MTKTKIFVSLLSYFLTANSFADPTPPPWMEPVASDVASIRDSVAAIQDSVTTLTGDLGTLEERTQAIMDSLDMLSSAVDARFAELDTSLATAETNISGRIDATEGSLLARIASLESQIDGAVDLIRADISALGASDSASQWISPRWFVRQEVATTWVQVFNPSFESDVRVDFNFYDRDGVLDLTFSTARILPPRSTIQISGDDRGIDPGRAGWLQVVADGPILPEGFINTVGGIPGVTKSETQRPLVWYPIQ